MLSVILKVFAVLAGFASAGCWLFAGKTISREQELERRRRKAAKTGKKVSLGGVELIDDEVSYDLIATLRHQSQWSRAGAVLAGIAIFLQAVDMSTSSF